MTNCNPKSKAWGHVVVFNRLRGVMNTGPAEPAKPYNNYQISAIDTSTIYMSNISNITYMSDTIDKCLEKVLLCVNFKTSNELEIPLRSKRQKSCTGGHTNDSEAGKNILKKLSTR